MFAGFACGGAARNAGRPFQYDEGEDAPIKYWLSTLPAGTPIATLVDTAKLRWRIERDFQDLKQEIGLDHSRVEAGEDSITTRRSRSRPTNSSSQRGVRIPPQAPSAKRSSQECRRRTKATVRADTPLRPERHTSNSISTCESSLPSSLPSGCRDAHAACERAMGREYVAYDTVRLVLMDELWHMANSQFVLGRQSICPRCSRKGGGVDLLNFNDHLTDQGGSDRPRCWRTCWFFFFGGEEERGAEGGGRRGRRLE